MAGAGSKENIKIGSCKWKPIKRSPTGNNLDFNVNAMGSHWERPQCMVIESVSSGVDILSMLHTSSVALDKLLNLSVKFLFSYFISTQNEYYHLLQRIIEGLSKLHTELRTVPGSWKALKHDF